MLSVDDAHRLIATHLGDTPRAVHSVLVGKLMRRLADETGADPLLWEITGLCHDLDFDVVAGDWSRHGMLAAEWLAELLPEDALLAIRAHDHRTGVISNTPLARCLKLADAVAIAHDGAGPELLEMLATSAATDLASRLSDRPYLAAMIVRLAELSGHPAPNARPHTDSLALAALPTLAGRFILTL